jgi:nitroreductase
VEIMTSVLAPLVSAFPRPDVAADFSSRAVGDEEIGALLGAARIAPSADNFQTWRFVAVRSAEVRAQLADAAAGPVAPATRSAPVVIVACGVKAVVTRKRSEQPFVWLDVPIALTQLLLQAAEIGLRCSWTFELDETRVRSALGVPEGVRVIALCALGWPAERAQALG